MSSVPPSASRQAASAASASRGATRVPAFDDHSDLMRLDLSDIPYTSPGLHVEALQPSLLSRVFGLLAR